MLADVRSYLQTMLAEEGLLTDEADRKETVLTFTEYVGWNDGVLTEDADDSLLLVRFADWVLGVADIRPSISSRHRARNTNWLHIGWVICRFSMSILMFFFRNSVQIFRLFLCVHTYSTVHSVHAKKVSRLKFNLVAIEVYVLASKIFVCGIVAKIKPVQKCTSL